MSISPYTDQLLQRLNQRLEHLELQAANYGIDVPVHIAMDIDSTKAQIEQIEVGSRSILSVELLEKMEPAERWKRLYDAIWQVEVDMYSIKKTLESDRHHNQSRHKEFNTTIQRLTFYMDMIKSTQRKIYYIALIICIFIFIEVYISFIRRGKYAPL